MELKAKLFYQVFFFGQLERSSSQNLLHQFLDSWLDKFDNMPQTRMRKLACMGMLCLLCLPQTPRDLIVFLPQIIIAAVGVIPESEGDIESHAELIGHFDAEVITYSHSAAEKQLQQLWETDIVHTTPLRAFLVGKLEEIATMHGPTFQTTLNAIDPIILKGLGGWGALKK